MISEPQTIIPDTNTSSNKQYMDIFSDNKIYGGIHRFCLRIRGISSNDKFCKFKFGVSCNKTDENSVECFSDLDLGFAFYSVGQTRNGSNNSGFMYSPGFTSFSIHIIIK